MSKNLGYRGLADSSSGQGAYNDNLFFIEQVLARIGTATLVKIIAVTNSGGLSPVGFVDVQPLVNQVDGAMNSVPHGPIYHLPYFRLQGGANAVIIDPQAGDIGIAVFASHDISSVNNTKAQANPGSGRRFDMSDGLYLGGVLNGLPSQYVQFTAGGINVVSPTKVTITAPQVEVDATTMTINANTIINGSLSQGTGASGGGATMLGPIVVTNDVTAGGKSLIHHVHGGVTAGGANTGQPI